MIKKNECTCTGKYPMKYIFCEAENSYFEKYLVVTFSAIPSKDSEIKQRYSYMRVLEGIPCNKLFLQDSMGEYGTYYLCENLDFDVSECVSNIIEEIRVKNNIDKKNVICLGSSKGATAALYHGCKGGYGNVLAMGPQTRIADFLLLNPEDTVHRRIFSDMIGKNSVNIARELLNNVILDVVEKRKNTKIHLLSSENDDQYFTHIKPLLDILKYYQDDIKIDNRILSHSDLARVNPQYVKDCLFNIFLSARDYMDSSFEYNCEKIFCSHLQADIFIKKIDFREMVEKATISYQLLVFPDQVIISIDTSLQKEMVTFAFYAVSSEETIKTSYSSENEKVFNDLKAGLWRIKYYVRIGDYTKSFYTKAFQILEKDQ